MLLVNVAKEVELGILVMVREHAMGTRLTDLNRGPHVKLRPPIHRS